MHPINAEFSERYKTAVLSSYTKEFVKQEQHSSLREQLKENDQLAKAQSARSPEKAKNKQNEVERHPA